VIKCIVSDIEGTTTSIDFVHKTLFPYSKRALPDYLKLHQHDPDVAETLRQIWQEEMHHFSEKNLDVNGVSIILQRWIDEDRKHPLLKQLQGKIWKNGYRAKHFLSHIYADVPQALNQWKNSGLILAIYSSGSVEAQKLLFSHTPFGDLCPLFSAFYDTSVGAKRDPNSYTNIQTLLKIEAEETLFLSDVIEELDAARLAGFKTYQICRDSSVKTGLHPIANSFDQVQMP
jgi:enolase-phosphatase E1